MAAEPRAAMRALGLSLALLGASLVAAIGAEKGDWPPRDPGERQAPAALTTAWAQTLRTAKTFADLQAAAGARGHLEAIDATGDAPHAVFDWTGAGGEGAMRVLLYPSGDFGAEVTPRDGKGTILVNNFGAFVCPMCAPPVRACGRRPSWVPHTLHWDVFDCGCTLIGPQSLAASAC